MIGRQLVLLEWKKRKKTKTGVKQLQKKQLQKIMGLLLALVLSFHVISSPIMAYDLQIANKGNSSDYLLATECNGGWDVSLISLNKYQFKPNETISGSLGYEIWNPSSCPACIQQLVIGINNDPKQCVYDGIPNDCPDKTSGTSDFSFPAPSSPGTYYIKVSNAYQYTCDAAMGNYLASSKKKIAEIVVIDDTTPTPPPTTPPPTTPPPTTPPPTTPPPTTPPPTTPPPLCPETYDPNNPNCNLDCPDSDGDDVPDCKDKCPDTPKWMSQNLSVDFEGCVYCLDKESECAVAVTFLTGFPTFGIEDILLDFCEIMVKILDGNLEGVTDEVIHLVADILFTVARILSTPLAPGVGDKVIGGLQTLLTCLPVLSNSEMEAVYEESVQQMANGNVDILSIYVGSSVAIEIKDDRENILNESNKNGIPNSYSLTTGTHQISLIANPSDDYSIEIQGLENGEYDLLVRIVQKGTITTAHDWSGMSIDKGAVHQYTVYVDSAQGTSRISEVTIRTEIPIYWQWMFAGLAILSGIGIGVAYVTSFSVARKRRILTLLLLGLLGALIGWLLWYLMFVGVIL